MTSGQESQVTPPPIRNQFPRSFTGTFFKQGNAEIGIIIERPSTFILKTSLGSVPCGTRERDYGADEIEMAGSFDTAGAGAGDIILAQLLQNGGIGLAGGVEQDHCSGVRPGQKLGKIDLSLDGKLLCSYDLTAPHYVEKTTFLSVLKEILATFSK